MKLLKLSTRKQQNTGDESKTEKKPRQWFHASCDMAALSGLVSVGYGLYQIYPPCMFIIIGAIVIITALIISR